MKEFFFYIVEKFFNAFVYAVVYIKVEECFNKKKKNASDGSQSIR